MRKYFNWSQRIIINCISTIRQFLYFSFDWTVVSMFRYFRNLVFSAKKKSCSSWGPGSATWENGMTFLISKTRGHVETNVCRRYEQVCLIVIMTVNTVSLSVLDWGQQFPRLLELIFRQTVIINLDHLSLSHLGRPCVWRVSELYQWGLSELEQLYN